MKPRIHIIGGPGSGKSYIAAKLAERFRVPHHDLDDLFWDRSAPRYGIAADSKERDRKLAEIVSQDGWIIEGVYYMWLGPSFDTADFIIDLTPNIWVRHPRVAWRFLTRKLKRDKSKRETFADFRRLLQWSHKYDTDNLMRARRFISQRGREAIACKNLDDVFSVVHTSVLYNYGDVSAEVFPPQAAALPQPPKQSVA
jgi:adenylate kinase family enzyme